MMRIRMKVDGDRVAVGVAATRETVTAVLMHDDRVAEMKTYPVERWNALPHHLFESKGPAPKTDVKFQTN